MNDHEKKVKKLNFYKTIYYLLCCKYQAKRLPSDAFLPFPFILIIAIHSPLKNLTIKIYCSFLETLN